MVPDGSESNRVSSNGDREGQAQVEKPSFAQVVIKVCVSWRHFFQCAGTATISFPWDLAVSRAVV